MGDDVMKYSRNVICNFDVIESYFLEFMYRLVVINEFDVSYALDFLFDSKFEMIAYLSAYQFTVHWKSDECDFRCFRKKKSIPRLFEIYSILNGTKPLRIEVEVYTDGELHPHEYEVWIT